MVNVQHKSLDEVRTTIRSELQKEQTYLKNLPQSQFIAVEKAKAQAIVNTYINVLHWLGDLPYGEAK